MHIFSKKRLVKYIMKNFQLKLLIDFYIILEIKYTIQVGIMQFKMKGGN